MNVLLTGGAGYIGSNTAVVLLLSDHQVVLYDTQGAWVQRSTDSAVVRPSKAAFAAIPSDSIDYAVSYLGEDEIVQFENTYDRTSA